MKAVLILLNFFLALQTIAFADKSSVIPDRREFPVNEKINPCENFYEYACSKVNDSFELRPDRSSHTFAFSDSAERILEFKKKYFAELESKKPSSALEASLKNYYLACMNEGGRKKEEEQLVKGAIDEVNKIKGKDGLASLLLQ